MNNKINLSALITNNILKEDQHGFLKENELLSEFIRSGKDFNYFIQDCVNKGRLNINNLSDFLFDSLFYGYQRETYIYNVSMYDDKLTPEDCINIIRSRFVYIDSLRYNAIVNKISDSSGQLVALKVDFGVHINNIVKIKFLFMQEVFVLNKNGSDKTISYIPIEWDLIQNFMIVKVAPKRRLFDKSLKPEYLNKYFSNIIIELFKLQIIPFNHIHKEAICEMSKDLYNQVYNKMVKIKPSGLDGIVEEMADTLKRKLGIEALELKMAVNNIFNIYDSLQKQIENILMSDILLDVEQGGSLEGITGVVTYLKFSDGKKISARLKGRECRDPIFDSESYMALRSAIENARQTSRLGVLWIDKFDRLRVCYDACNSECLNIHFYKNLKEDEFAYGLQMYREYERRAQGETKGVIGLEAKAQ